MKSWCFQKSRADNFRTLTAIQILRVRRKTRHHEDSMWKVLNMTMETVVGVATEEIANRPTDRQTYNWGYNKTQPFGRITRRKGWLPALSLFPTMFSKACFFQTCKKSRLCDNERKEKKKKNL